MGLRQLLFGSEEKDDESSDRETCNHEWSQNLTNHSSNRWSSLGLLHRGSGETIVEVGYTAHRYVKANWTTNYCTKCGVEREQVTIYAVREDRTNGESIETEVDETFTFYKSRESPTGDFRKEPIHESERMAEILANVFDRL